MLQNILNNIPHTFKKSHILMALLCPSIIALGACSSHQTKEDKASCQAAEFYGREAAMQLAPGVQPDTSAIESVLIDVRVREAALRDRGCDKMADSYITAFLNALDSVNPSLAHQLTEK